MGSFTLNDKRVSVDAAPNTPLLWAVRYHVPNEMHVQFVDVDTRPTGLGEIGNPFIAGAISNAFHRLTGKRLRHLPFTPDRVLETLKA